jgi:hypothetical protein
MEQTTWCMVSIDDLTAIDAVSFADFWNLGLVARSPSLLLTVSLAIHADLVLWPLEHRPQLLSVLGRRRFALPKPRRHAWLT